MAATIDIKPTIDPSAPGAMQELVASTQKLEAAMARLGAEGRRIASEESQRRRAAIQAERQLATDTAAAERIRRDAIGETSRALEDHKRKLAEIQRLQESGKLSPGMASRARAQEIERYTAPAREAENARRVEQETTARRLLTHEMERQRQAQEILGRQAAAVWAQTRTPLEQHKARLAELSGLLRNGKISQDTYNRAVDQARQAYEGAESAGKKAFGADSLGMLTRYIAGLVSIGTAIKTATSYLNDMQQKAQEAGQRGIDARLGMSALATLTTPGRDAQGRTPDEQMRGFTDRAWKVYESGAVPNLTAGADFVFQSQSMGAKPEDEAFFTRIGQAGLVKDLAAFMTSARTMQVAMGEKETGDLKSLAGKAFAAAAKTPLGPQAVLPAAAGAAQYGSALGLSDEEVIAAAGVMSAPAAGEKPQAKADLAKTQIRALFTALVRFTAGQADTEEGAQAVSLEQASADAKSTGGLGLTKAQIEHLKTLKDKSLSEMIRGIASMGLDEATINKMFSQQAYPAFTQFRADLPAYEQLLANVKTGAKGEAMETAIGVNERNPAILAATLAVQTKAKLEHAEEQRGAVYNLAEALQGDLKLRMKKEGWSDPAKWASAKVDDWKQWLMSNESYVESAYKNADPELQKKTRTIMGWSDRGPAFDRRLAYVRGLNPVEREEAYRKAKTAATWAKTDAERQDILTPFEESDRMNARVQADQIAAREESLRQQRHARIREMSPANLAPLESREPSSAGKSPFRPAQPMVYDLSEPFRKRPEELVDTRLHDPGETLRKRPEELVDTRLHDPGETLREPASKLVEAAREFRAAAADMRDASRKSPSMASPEVDR